MESEKRYGYSWALHCICDRKDGALLTEQDVLDRLNALEAERDRWRKAYEVLYANVCGDCGYAKEGMQLAVQALGGGDE